MNKIRLIGISGTNGSGKDTVGQILADDYGWFFISISNLLRNELSRRGLPIERKNMRMVSAEWRKQSGVGVLMNKALEEYQNQEQQFNGLVISNLRNPGEADEIHKLGGQVLWVDAEPELRYRRVSARLRSTEDHKTFEEFIKEEQEEMAYGGDENSLHMAGVKAKADIFITNNSSDLNSFKSQIKTALDL